MAMTSTGYFGRPIEAVTTAEAALLAAMIEDRRQDPWCNPEGVADGRKRILQRMLANGSINEPAFTAASAAPLTVVSGPPAPCARN